jgi:ubiquinone/menaquinone biosynthesis C-methylase UbiE/uncharacterized protein YbaR (Trm112 family)
MKKQTLMSKKAEVEFRQKLAAQQIYGESYFEYEYDRDQLDLVLAKRMEETCIDVGNLLALGVPVSPYLEIGAERGQRTLVLENDLEAWGVAADISFDMLKTCEYYAERFKKTALPTRVCCDANRLPFHSNSLAFVFCYATLHHFPDPSPIVHEVHRVLAPGGSFFFSEEPFKKMLHIPLYKRTKGSSHKNKILRAMDYFFSDIEGNEEKYGIVENEQIGLGLWKRSLDIFAERKVRIRSWLKDIQTPLFSPDKRMHYFWNYLTGGMITGHCRKAGQFVQSHSNLMEILACPLCLEKGQEADLFEKGGDIYCSACGFHYPKRDGVLFLLTPQQLAALYPDLVSRSMN